MSDPAPNADRRRRWQWELLGIVASMAMVLAAYYPVAFGGKTFDTSALVAGVNGNDPPTGVPPLHVVDPVRPDRGAGAWQMTPWATVTHRQYAEGHWPLWNPYEGIGEPLAGNVQSAVFDPLLLPVDLHPTTRTWDLTILFAFMLGAAATYLFLRNLGICTLAAVGGAGVYTMSGFFAMNVGDPVVHLYAYLPMLFLTIDLVARSSKLRWVAAMGAAIAGGILAGMLESTFFVFAAAAPYAAYRTLKAPAGTRWTTAFRMGWAALFGLALASPLLVLVLQYLPLSFNSHNTSVGARTGAGAALLSWMIPFVNGYPTMPRLPGYQLDRGWLGAGVFAMGAVAAAAPRAMRKFGGWFFLALGSLVLAKNHHIRFFQWIGHLPAFSQSDSIAFAPPVAALAFAVVAAIGIHAVATREIRWRRLVVAIAVLGGLVGFLLQANRPVLAVAHDAFARHNYSLAIGGGGAVLLAAFIVVLLRNRRVGVVAAWVATIAILGELFSLFPRTIYAPRYDPYRPPPWLASVEQGRAQEPAARVFGFDQVLYPNTAGVFSLADVRTINGLFISRYATYLKNFVFPFVDRYTGDVLPAGSVEANPMFDLLGVRYVLARSETLDAGEGAGQYRDVGGASGVRVYENGHRIPRAFVVHDVHEVGGMGDAVSYLQSLGHAMADGTTHVDLFDPAHQAVVEVSGSQAAPLPSLPPDQSAPRPVRLVSYGSQRVELEVPAGAPGLLVLTDAYFPGWRATVNGRAAPIMPTDVAFRGVMLSGDAATVVFTYHAPGGNLGWGIPVLAGLALLAAAFVRRARSQHAGPEHGR